uniref:Uncharacterized protein n=1 Tax=Anopheles culicifacies TaxID=139723 RepID=A0A182MUY6_9DIPT
MSGMAPMAPPPPASGIPVYHQSGGTTASPKHKSSSFFNTFSRGMKSAGRGDKVIDRGGNTAPTLVAADHPLYGTTGQPMYHHQGQTSTVMLHRHGTLGSIGNGGMVGPEGSKEETVQPPSAIPPMAHVLNSPATDRRHRSPDPPPR